LRAQIALLQSSLQASHQRIATLTSELNLNTSTSTSGGRLSPYQPPTSPSAWSPSVNGDISELPEVDDQSMLVENGRSSVEPIQEEAGEEAARPNCPLNRNRLPNKLTSLIYSSTILRC
jgi:hypothetical protein